MFSCCWYSFFIFFLFLIIQVKLYFCLQFLVIYLCIYSSLGCDNSTGCVFVDVNCTQPTNLCQSTVRDPTYPGCCRTINNSCSENTLCETHACNPATGLCVTTSLCVQDPNNLCKSFYLFFSSFRLYFIFFLRD